MIEDLRQRKPIRVILENVDLGIFTFNQEKNRYEGIGFLTLETIKRVLKGEIDFIQIKKEGI